MMDRQAHLKKLRGDAAECAAFSRLAFDEKKRALFADLAEHLTLLADEVERMVEPPKRNNAVGAASSSPGLQPPK